MAMNSYNKVKTFLQRKLKKKVKLTTTRKKELQVIAEEKDKLVSLKVNAIFLKAPFQILENLIDYFKTKNPQSEKILKEFLNNNKSLNNNNISKPEVVKEIKYDEKISHQGRNHNLKVVFDMLNEKYFDNSISANITWSDKFNSKGSKEIEYSVFESKLNLIKINQFLDKSMVPKYFIGYVIFNEMLSCFFSNQDNKSNKKKDNSEELHEWEKKYHAFNKAREWERQNGEKLKLNSGAGT
jgi:hypothetical protein